MMKNKKILLGALIVATLVIIGSILFVLKQPTIPTITPSESNFNLIFKYGVGAGNELNTFKGIYTKGMVTDSPITVNLSLSKDDLNKIYQKIIKINFFNYPDKFSVSILFGETVGEVTPHSSYYFKIKYNSKVKELWWEDNIVNKDEKTEKLRGLVRLIIDIIESKEEYKKLPPPRGGNL
ncbi:hypothetical protein E3V08_02295 [Candidatus Atribacteria bacterium MT.SAG.1]|nr:hypothetical protein E3V08_02295 [Candidatus Atribacteria bacterium MT.SAG.1]